jgi:hypothetical protein
MTYIYYLFSSYLDTLFVQYITAGLATRELFAACACDHLTANGALDIALGTFTGVSLGRRRGRA